MTIIEERLAITGGVDTHSEVHVAAALDPVGGLLGVREFPATAAGYAGLLGWLGEFGDAADWVGASSSLMPSSGGWTSSSSRW